jgi:alpha/beta superfamily hydrolase
MRKMRNWALWGAMAFLAGCGGGGSNLGGTVTTDNSGARGSLQINPPLRVAALSATDFTGQLNASSSGQSLMAIAGTPRCGVNFHYIKYGTVGGNSAAPEVTNATGALMVPTGTDPACTGARPVVLYAHGTTTSKSFNLANVIDQTNDAYSESILVAAMFAAQGFIVVAPNYAGYDASTLPYHPYLNADQESKEMIDALTAARKAFANVGASDSGKLFITGYSQGGHVAMATHKAMQALNMAVTASAPMSGPYAMAAFGDALFSGQVDLGGTVFAPLLATSYQKAYGNIYTNLTDLYNPTYATGIDTLLPSTLSMTQIFSQGKLPQTALFNITPPTAPSGSGLQPTLNAMTPPTSPAASAPLFALGFGSNYLINNTARLSYLLDAAQNPDGALPTVTTGMPAAAPANPMRVAFKINDLRGWSPARPVLLCGGNADPTVFYSVNTGVMQSLWSVQQSAGLVTVLDVDSNPTGSSDPFAAAKVGFGQAKSQTYAAGAANGGGATGGSAAVLQSYHGTLVPPFCTASARGFFQQVLSLNL